jgi:Ala-tRNA(Pro) deacylase
MPTKKLKAFLDENDVRYVTLKHSRAYTAQELAAKTHISGKEVAKTVIVKVDGKLAMMVLPASYRVDFKLLKQLFGTQQVTLATEAEFEYFFPDCEVGAMPPFGNLYDMEVYVAESLAEDYQIAFNNGSHTEMIKMSYEDFERLVQPIVIRFSKKEVSLPRDPEDRWVEEY